MTGQRRVRRTGSPRKPVTKTARATDWHRPGYLEARGEEEFRCSLCCRDVKIKDGMTVSRRGRAWLICDAHQHQGPAEIWDRIQAKSRVTGGKPCADVA